MGIIRLLRAGFELQKRNAKSEAVQIPKFVVMCMHVRICIDKKIQFVGLNPLQHPFLMSEGRVHGWIRKFICDIRINLAVSKTPSAG